MAISLSVIKPLAATNYLTNPSFEVWSAGPVPTGWTKVADTLSQSSTYTWRGAYSCEVVQAGTGYGGIYQDVAGTNTQSYTCSVYVYVASGTMKIVATDYGGTSNPITAVSTGTGWQRLTVIKVAASGGLRMYIECNNVAATFYIDAAQVEDGTEATTYIDGDESGCYWNGTRAISTSTRDDQSREGGQIVSLTATNYLNKFLDISGMGMPAFTNVSLPFGLTGGEIYQRTVKQARTFIVTGLLTGTSMDNLHYKRRLLEDLLKFDAVTPVQPLKLLYNDGVSATTLTIHAVYDGGLEGQAFEGLGDNGVMERVALRFIAHDPCWYSDQQMCQVLGYSQPVDDANRILQRKIGVWSALNYGADDFVRCMAYGPDGCLYIGGDFVHCGNASAGDLTVNGIAKWNGTAWSALGGTPGVAGGTPSVYTMFFGADGCLYIGGGFTSAGGVSYTAYIAKWDGSVFTPLGRGADAEVTALAFDSAGLLYVGGSFTHVHATGGADVSDTLSIAKWDGSTWTALGTGTNGAVKAMACSKDGYVYIVGTFVTANGVTVNQVAKWNGTTFVSLAGGVGIVGYTDVFALTFGLDGKLYIGGFFTTAGGVAILNIAVWNGTAWAPLGSGVNNTVYSLHTAPDGNIYAGGTFTVAGGLALVDRVAYWVGSTWLPMDVNFPSTATVFAIIFDPRNNLYAGYNTAGSATSATVTVSANASTKSYPKFWFVGPGTIYQIINYTTGRSIYFKNLTLQAGEVAFLELMPGSVRFYSYWRGELGNYILNGSNLDFYLQPGNNNISAYLVGSTAASLIHLRWQNTSWAFDSVT